MKLNIQVFLAFFECLVSIRKYIFSNEISVLVDSNRKFTMASNLYKPSDSERLAL